MKRIEKGINLQAVIAEVASVRHHDREEYDAAETLMNVSKALYKIVDELAALRQAEPVAWMITLPGGRGSWSETDWNEVLKYRESGQSYGVEPLVYSQKRGEDES